MELPAQRTGKKVINSWRDKGNKVIGLKTVIRT
jgi:hypothetical protein